MQYTRTVANPHRTNSKSDYEPSFLWADSQQYTTEWSYFQKLRARDFVAEITTQATEITKQNQFRRFSTEHGDCRICVVSVDRLSYKPLIGPKQSAT